MCEPANGSRSCCGRSVAAMVGVWGSYRGCKSKVPKRTAGSLEVGSRQSIARNGECREIGCSTVIIIPAACYSEAAGEAEVHWKEGGHWWCPASASVTASLPTNQYPNHPPTSPFQIQTKLFPNKPKIFFCTALSNQPISQRQPKLT